MNYKEFLKNDILPVWIKISPDAANGGVFTRFDRKHTPKGDGKSLMSLGRSLWFFSTANIHLESGKEHLDICESIFLFLKTCTLENGKLPFSVTCDGKPLTVTKRTFYAEMYCAMGCAQYYKATKDPDVKKYCEALFNFVYEQYLSQQSTCQDEDEGRNSKCFGVHMTALMMAQAVRSSGIRRDMADEIAGLAIGQMMESGFVDDAKKCVYEHAPLSGKKLSGADAVFSCPGHIYEAAWFVMSEGELKNDDSFRLFGKKLLDYAMPFGFEKITEFIPTSFDTGKSVEENTASGRFDAFPQQEAIIAFSLAYSIFGERKYLQMAERLEKSLNSYYEKFDDIFWCGTIRKENGEYADILPERGHYNSPFHLERYLLVLDYLRKNRGIASYVNQKGNPDGYISS